MRFRVGATWVWVLVSALLQVGNCEPLSAGLAGMGLAQAESNEPVVLATAKHRRRTVAKSSPTKRRVQSSASSASAEFEAFQSLEQCLTLLARGQRAVRDPNTARIATWNVRWFPDGSPDDAADSSRPTNVEWLACALAFMNVDAIALEEIKPKGRSEAALAQLTKRLDELTNGRHAVHLDDCPEENGQHLAWLVNEQRVTTSDWATHAALNPNGDACTGQLRPGLGVRLRFAGGLDLYALALHLKSGSDRSDLMLRRSSIDGLERVMRSVATRSGDTDVLVAGDFNSMGCRECSDVPRSSAEAGWLDTRLRAFRPEVRRVPSDLGCSQYYRQQPSLLDHFLVTRSMREAGLEPAARVYGYCRTLGCESYTGAESSSQVQLSDHCPIVLSLQDQDMD